MIRRALQCPRNSFRKKGTAKMAGLLSLTPTLRLSSPLIGGNFREIGSKPWPLHGSSLLLPTRTAQA